MISAPEHQSASTEPVAPDGRCVFPRFPRGRTLQKRRKCAVEPIDLPGRRRSGRPAQAAPSAAALCVVAVASGAEAADVGLPALLTPCIADEPEERRPSSPVRLHDSLTAVLPRPPVSVPSRDFRWHPQQPHPPPTALPAAALSLIAAHASEAAERRTPLTARRPDGLRDRLLTPAAPPLSARLPSRQLHTRGSQRSPRPMWRPLLTTDRGSEQGSASRLADAAGSVFGEGDVTVMNHLDAKREWTHAVTTVLQRKLKEHWRKLCAGEGPLRSEVGPVWPADSGRPVPLPRAAGPDRPRTAGIEQFSNDDIIAAIKLTETRIASLRSSLEEEEHELRQEWSPPQLPAEPEDPAVRSEQGWHTVGSLPRTPTDGASSLKDDTVSGGAAWIGSRQTTQFTGLELTLPAVHSRGDPTTPADVDPSTPGGSPASPGQTSRASGPLTPSPPRSPGKNASPAAGKSAARAVHVERLPPNLRSQASSRLSADREMSTHGSFVSRGRSPTTAAASPAEPEEDELESVSSWNSDQHSSSSSGSSEAPTKRTADRIRKLNRLHQKTHRLRGNLAGAVAMLSNKGNKYKRQTVRDEIEDAITTGRRARDQAETVMAKFMELREKRVAELQNLRSNIMQCAEVAERNCHRLQSQLRASVRALNQMRTKRGQVLSEQMRMVTLIAAHKSRVARGQEELKKMITAGQREAKKKKKGKEKEEEPQQKEKSWDDAEAQTDFPGSLADIQKEAAELEARENAIRNAVSRLRDAAERLTACDCSLEAEVTCTQCTNVLTQPRMLFPCGHSFCENCVRQQRVTPGRDLWQCSHCGQECDGHVPNHSVAQISAKWAVKESGTHDLALAIAAFFQELNDDHEKQHSVSGLSASQVTPSITIG